MSAVSRVKFRVGDRVRCSSSENFRYVRDIIYYNTQARLLPACVSALLDSKVDFNPDTIFRILTTDKQLLRVIPERLYQDSEACMFFRHELRELRWYSWRFIPYIDITATRRLTVKPTYCEGV